MAAVLDSVRAFFAPSIFSIDAENPSDVVARENLLRKVLRGGFVSQVPQSIKPYARSPSLEQLRFGLTVASQADQAYQLGIVQIHVHEHNVNHLTFYV